MTSFDSLRLAAPILRAIADSGYTNPTPIQLKAIPPVLEGRDLLGCAQTGTGKTAAFALPIIDRIERTRPDKSRRGPRLPRALILSPTRELATQIADSFEAYGKHVFLDCAVIFGGVGQNPQVHALRSGVDVLVATPGRLMDLMEQGHINFSAIEVFVLDEADRMLDMGFIQPIRTIVSKLPKQRQTLLFSATMPKAIEHLADSLLRNPVRVSVAPVSSTAALIDQSVYMVPKRSKPALLSELLKDRGIERALVFTRTKHGADRLSRKLKQGGVSAEAIHGDKSQSQRQRALEGFKNGRSRVLVATDVAARGLDIDSVTHVFNFDIPNEPEAYVHRIGRTGRAGASGIAISFCDHDERVFLRDIERLTGKRVRAITELPNLPEEARHQESLRMESGDNHAARRAGPGRSDRGRSVGNRNTRPDHSQSAREPHPVARSRQKNQETVGAAPRRDKPGASPVAAKPRYNPMAKNRRPRTGTHAE